MVVKNQAGIELTVTHNVDAIVRQLVAKGNPYSAAQELVINELDEFPPTEDFSSGEALVDIQIEHGNYFRVIGWSKGFHRENLEGFVNFMKSRKEGSAHQTGRVGSGRTHIFAFANLLRVTSVSAEFPKGVMFEFSIDDLLNPGKIIKPIIGVKLPDFFKVETTGTVVEVLGIDWKKVPKEKDFAEELPLRFSSFAASVLRLNGEPLKERAFTHEPFRDQQFVQKLGGLCRWDIFIPASGTRRREAVELGGRISSIISLTNFLKGCQHLTDTVPEILRDGSVVGNILIPGLNNFRLHDSASLDPKVYEEFYMDVLVLLRDIGVQAEGFFSDIQSAAQREKNLERIRDFTQRVNTVTGYDPDDVVHDGPHDGPILTTGPKGPSVIHRPPFLVSVRDPHLVAGTLLETRIMAYAETSGNFEVTVEPGKGKVVQVEKTKSLTFEIRAKSPGTALITYFDAKNNKKFVTSTVTVVKAAGLQLTPIYGEIVQGSVGDARIAHPEMLTSDQTPKYRHDAKGGTVQLVPRTHAHRRSVSIEVGDKCPLGEFTISVVVPGTDLKAECRRKVVGRGSEDPPIRIEDRHYRIVATRRVSDAMMMPSDEVHAREGTGSIFIVKLWVDHPVFSVAEPNDQDFMMLHSLIDIHLSKLGLSDGPERISRFDKIRTEILLGFREGSKPRKRRKA